MSGTGARAVIAFASAAVLLAGCGSFTSFQTAESMMPGETSVALTGALLADRGGFQGGLRVREGLGSGFEVGAEASGPMFLSGADLKWQFLGRSSEKEETGSPVSAALDVGLGAGPLTIYGFGQLIVSRRWDWFEPYVSYRLQLVRIDADLADSDDDVYDSIFEEIVRKADGNGILFHHLFLGARIHVWKGLSVVPEVSLLVYEGERGLGDAGIAIEYRWE